MTKMTLTDNVLRIFPREGGYPGMPDAADLRILWHREDGTVIEKTAERCEDGSLVCGG